MNAGKLRHAVYILKFEDSKDAKGDRIRKHQHIPPTADILPDDWADIDAVKGRELVVAMGIRSDITHKITMRYRSDIQPGDQIGWVENEFPMIYHVYELGPALDTELKGIEMTFYGVQIQ